MHTTLDLDLQTAAEQGGQRYLPNPAGPSAAVVAIDNKSGEVRAMVGGRDYAERPFNLATQGQRQPGSSIKPFILASALKKGYRPRVAVAVAQARVHRAGHQRRARSSSSTTSRASTRARRRWRAALTYSDNSVYSTVGITVGTKQIAALAERMGIRTPVSRTTR